MEPVTLYSLHTLLSSRVEKRRCQQHLKLQCDVVSQLYRHGCPLIALKILSLLPRADLASSLFVSRTWKEQVASSARLTTRVKAYYVYCKRNVENRFKLTSPSKKGCFRSTCNRQALATVDSNVCLDLPPSFSALPLATSKNAQCTSNPLSSAESEASWCCQSEKGRKRNLEEAITVDPSLVVIGTQKCKKRLRRL